MKPASPATRTIVTTTVVLTALAAVGWTYWNYLIYPWTRNGYVMAQVVQVTPRVSGTIVDLRARDNQFVNAGDLLFQIDPRTFQSTVDGLAANLDATIDEIGALARQVEASEAAVGRYQAAVARAEQKVIGQGARLKDYQLQLERYSRLVKEGAASQERVDRAEADVADTQAKVTGAKDELAAAQASLIQAEADLARDRANLGAAGEANARLRRAKAQLHSASLQLEFTTVIAPVDGYITNLNLRYGDHATANKPLLALVDTSSYWVFGFFKETALERVRVGNRALVTLMGSRDRPLEGRVETMGWGVWQSDGAIGEQLLPKIAAAFEWVRQAQRVPVRIQLLDVPEDVKLRVGSTASVVIMTGTDVPAPPEPPPQEPVYPEVHAHH